MNILRHSKFLGVLGLLVLSGCAGSVYEPAPSILPPHIRKINVRPFANKTQFFGLEEKLWLGVTNEFIRDGRIATVSYGKEKPVCSDPNEGCWSRNRRGITKVRVSS